MRIDMDPLRKRKQANESNTRTYIHTCRCMYLPSHSLLSVCTQQASAMKIAPPFKTRAAGDAGRIPMPRHHQGAPRDPHHPAHARTSVIRYCITEVIMVPCTAAQLSSEVAVQGRVLALSLPRL